MGEEVYHTFFEVQQSTFPTRNGTERIMATRNKRIAFVVCLANYPVETGPGLDGRVPQGGQRV